jgi:hypothetical protein
METTTKATKAARLFDGKRWRLCIDQYGGKVYARTAKELKQNAGPGRLFKVYVDRKDGATYHVGYGVGRRWFAVWCEMEVPATR